jgi:hypothetical protein
VFGVPLLYLRLAGAAVVVAALWFGYHSIRSAGYADGEAHVHVEVVKAENKRAADEHRRFEINRQNVDATARSYHDEITAVETSYANLPADDDGVRAGSDAAACASGAGDSRPAARADGAAAAGVRRPTGVTMREKRLAERFDKQAAQLSALQHYVSTVCAVDQ